MAKIETHINRKKLFGDRSGRITSEELFSVYREVMKKTHHLFRIFDVPKFFEEKKDHGDLDIVVIPFSSSWYSEFLQIFRDQILDYSVNGQCHSFLYRSDIGKDVHVDVIAVYHMFFFEAMIHYYGFNDLSAIIGVIARRRNYKYSTLGFYRRYKDTKGNNHTILLSLNLNEGLVALGYNPEKFHQIKSINDGIAFVQSSPFFDHRYFQFDHMTQKEKKDYKRPNIQYMTNVFRTTIEESYIDDGDHFVKKHFPLWMERIEKKIVHIEKGAHHRMTHNGYWLNKYFPYILGSDIRTVLDEIRRYFGLNLARTEDTVVIDHILTFLKKEK